MSQRPKLLGIDVGAKVERGGNWRWANQDGKLVYTESTCIDVQIDHCVVIKYMLF